MGGERDEQISTSSDYTDSDPDDRENHGLAHNDQISSLSQSLDPLVEEESKSFSSPSDPSIKSLSNQTSENSVQNSGEESKALPTDPKALAREQKRLAKIERERKK